MSPSRKKPGVPPKANRNHASAAAVGDLQALIDQVQALRRRHKAQPSVRSAAELSRLRERLLEALDLDEDDTQPDQDDMETSGEFPGAHGQLGYGDDMQEEVWDDGESGEWRARRDWSRFTPARRIPVDDGLELRSRRGVIGESWWSRRFLSAVESILTGGRLTRGRTYARQGQVIDLGIGSGLVVAQVQGTRRTPYGVQISMPALSDERWDAIVETLAGQAGYAARLLAGELPHEIEDVFAEVGAALFPGGSHLITDCTCPDWATPCKHAAAVCYLMAEAFDDDPFLLLAFRGREREVLLAELRARRAGTVDGSANGEPDSSDPAVPIPPLSEYVSSFWHVGEELAEVHSLPRATEVPGAVLRLLPEGVLVVRGREVADLLEAAYGRLTAEAEARAFAGGPSSR